MATKEELRQKQKEMEELRQKQKELLELTQRKQELEQELKVLRPVSKCCVIRLMYFGNPFKGKPRTLIHAMLEKYYCSVEQY